MPVSEEEFRALQRQVRRQRRWNVALVATMAVGGLMAANGVRSVPDVIRAKKFEVVGGTGTALVELGSNRNGNGAVTTRNEQGRRLVRLGATTGGNGFVTTLNGMGGNLVELGATVDGQGSVETQNGGGQALVRLGSYSSTRGGYVETFTTYGASTGEFPEP